MEWEYPVAAHGGENVEVARVNEVENNGAQGALPFLETVGDSVFSLLGRSQRTNHRLQPYRRLRHCLTTGQADDQQHTTTRGLRSNYNQLALEIKRA
ncbi:hypothetical protein SLE2022_395490 [Rubroshorea leprosula]